MSGCGTSALPFDRQKETRRGGNISLDLFELSGLSRSEGPESALKSTCTSAEDPIDSGNKAENPRPQYFRGAVKAMFHRADELRHGWTYSLLDPSLPIVNVRFIRMEEGVMF
jgi:hypothetical protein